MALSQNRKFCLRLRPLCLLLTLSVAGSVAVQASPLTFFGEDTNGDPLSRVSFPASTAARNSFLGQLSGSSTNNLESLTANSLVPVNLLFTGNSATVTGGNSAVRSLTSGTDGFGEYPTSGNTYIAVDSNSGLTLTFLNAVTSFGFYATDVGDFAGGAHLAVTFSGGGKSFSPTINNVLTSGRGTAADGSVLFFGYIDSANPFTTVQITSIGDSFGFDDPVIGVNSVITSTPEPGSLFLLAAGMILFSAKYLKTNRV